MPLQNCPWWDPKLARNGSEAPPHVRLIPLVESLKQSQMQRYTNMRRMSAVYEYGFAASANSSNDAIAIDDRALHFNPSKNAIDTMHAQVCTPRIAPMIITSGGTKSQRDRAKMATKALEGVLADNDFDEIQEDAILDGMLQYCGFVQVCSRVCGSEGNEHAELLLERVIPEDILVDAAEGRDRKPRCLYRRRFIDRYVVLADYGDADPDLYGSARDRKRAIKKCRMAKSTLDDWGTTETDQIEMWEAWHLPSANVDDDDSGANAGDEESTTK